MGPKQKQKNNKNISQRKKQQRKMAEAIFAELEKAVTDPANADKVKKINGVFAFVLKDPASAWTLDLKSGKVAKGKPGKADVTLTMAENDFLGLMSGKANGQQLFMSGKIKFKGNMGLVMKLGDLQKLQ